MHLDLWILDLGLGLDDKHNANAESLRGVLCATCDGLGHSLRSFKTTH